MPSFTGSKYDIFISYRQADNKHGWVTLFDSALRSMLDEHARPGKNEPPWKYEIFRDNKEIGGNEELGGVIHEAVNSTAVLLIVLSENYLATDSDWCAKELAMFRAVLSKSPQRDGRIFVVMRTDVPVQRRPAELRPFVGYTFWELDATSGRQMPISFDFSKTGRVPLECQKLGDDIFETLRKLRAARTAPATATAPPPAAGPTVFLAEVTDELYGDRSGFFTFLTQAGIRVVPGKNQQYRFTPDAAQTEIVPLLNDATLVVQMHGRTAIPSDDAYAGGFEAWLLAQAQAAGKKPGATLLRWRRQEAKADDLAPAHRELVFGGDVIAEDLEQFKQLIVQRVHELTQRSAVSVGGQGPKVLVLAKSDDSHTSVVDNLTDIIDGDGPELTRKPIQARVISGQTSLEMIAKEFEEQNAQPLALVVVHADGDESWVQDQMQQCRNYQLKKRPNMPLCAVVVKPPDDQMHPRSKPGRFDIIPHNDEAMQKAFLAKLAEASP